MESEEKTLRIFNVNNTLNLNPLDFINTSICYCPEAIRSPIDEKKCICGGLYVEKEKVSRKGKRKASKHKNKEDIE